MIKTPRLREIWIVGDARRDARGTGGPISRKQRTRGGGGCRQGAREMAGLVAESRTATLIFIEAKRERGEGRGA